MISIELGNSYSRITGLTAKQEKDLKEELSYVVGGSSAYFSGYGIHKKSLLDKKGYFPTGILHRVVTKDVHIVDNRIRPPSWPLELTFQPNAYPWQVNAVKAAYNHARGIISAPTGTGKSLAMKMLIDNLGIKTLVVVPTLEIKKQLKEILPNTVIVENIDSSVLRDVNTYKGINCLIIDEAHHSASKTYRILNKRMWQSIYHRYFFTATPFRNDTEETLLFESIAGEVIYKLDYKTAIKNKYIVRVEAFYVDLPKTKNTCHTYQEVYKKLVVNNEYRNTVILNMLLKLSMSGKSALCLVNEVQHGHNIKHPHFVSGEDEISRELIKHFNIGTIKTLVATTGIMGEGIDSKPCEYIVIAGLGKAKSRFMQQVGRAVRNYPGKESAKVILFRDPSNKYLLRHYNEQRKILLDIYGIEPVKLNL